MSVFIDIFTALLGAITTFYLDSRIRLSKVEASALPTFIFASVFFLVSPLLKLEQSLVDHWVAVFFGATFIGMTSSKLANFKVIAIAAIIFAPIYLRTLKSFDGFGGKLGFLACISVVVAIGVKYFFVQLRNLFNK